jgi:hypothetical protein
MGLKGVRSADPSPEQIAAMTAMIRRKWDKKEMRKRDERPVYRVPVLSPASLSLEPPTVRLY